MEQALWSYIALHFVNHALGLFPLDAAAAALKLAAFVWQSLPGTVLLYGAAATHVVLALASLHRRHTLHLPPAEMLCTGFGLTIPLLLLGYMVSTRVAYEWFGEAPYYRRIVTNLIRSGNTRWQLALLALGWARGCMGRNVAFRHHAWFQRRRPALLAAVVGLPLLAAGRFWVMTRGLADVANAAAALRAARRDPPAATRPFARTPAQRLTQACHFSVHFPTSSAADPHGCSGSF